MRIAAAVLCVFVRLSAADGTALERKILSLREAAAALVRGSDLSAAEEKLQAALEACAGLPARQVFIRTELRREIGNLYSRQKKAGKAESAYKSRLDLLERQQRVGPPPILELGIALFDLQSLYTATGRLQEAQTYMERGRAFYQACKSGYPNMRATCDRRLADVEGMQGSGLFLNKRYDEALPFLEAVTARPDDGVRPEVLYAALMGEAQILRSRLRLPTAMRLTQRAQRVKAAHPSNFPAQ
jgi:tetratricopeptide (TPR) repeat protein